jgi:hypothetical protein
MAMSKESAIGVHFHPIAYGDLAGALLSRTVYTDTTLETHAHPAQRRARLSAQ